MTTDTHADTKRPRMSAADRPEDADQWTAKLRHAAVEALPPQRLLPDRQPAYVASWIYVFGVVTIAALAVVIVTGMVLAVFGPTWWHLSSTGLFVNSLHLWSVEVFFFAMVVHLWGKFFMAAWRGRRRATWITGVVAFVVSVGRSLHRLPVPAELRLPVDQHPGQGRHQCDRRRRHLQRHQLRPDAHVAHHAPAPGRRAPRRPARAAGPPTWGGSTLCPTHRSPCRLEAEPDSAAEPTSNPGAAMTAVDRRRPRSTARRAVQPRPRRRGMAREVPSLRPGERIPRRAGGGVRPGGRAWR